MNVASLEKTKILKEISKTYKIGLKVLFVYFAITLLSIIAFSLFFAHIEEQTVVDDTNRKYKSIIDDPKIIVIIVTLILILILTGYSVYLYN